MKNNTMIGLFNEQNELVGYFNTEKEIKDYMSLQSSLKVKTTNWTHKNVIFKG